MDVGKDHSEVKRLWDPCLVQGKTVHEIVPIYPMIIHIVHVIQLLNFPGPGQTQWFDQKDPSRNQGPYEADAQDVALHHPEMAAERVANYDWGGEEGIFAGWLWRGDLAKIHK